MPSRWLGWWLGMLLALACASAVPTAADESSAEHRIKAAFLFNFAKFVEWPSGAFPSASAPLVIGILGTDPFGAALDELVAGEAANGHALVVRRVAALDGCGDCHIIFVAESERAREAEIRSGVAGRPVLLVSDLDGFADRGGTIALVSRENRIRLRINQQRAAAAGLVLSSKLLGLADVVSSEHAPERSDHK